MSSKEECKKIIKRYSRARIPFLSVDTVERGRALSLIESVASSLSMHFYVHSMSSGTCDIVTGKTVNEGRTILDAVDYMSDQMRKRGNLTLVLTEAPNISSDNPDARMLLDLVSLASESGGMIIIISNDPVWNRIQRLGMRITLDLPDDGEMFDIVNGYIEAYRGRVAIEWDEADIKEAASLLVGATAIEAQNVITSLIANGSVGKSDMDEVRFSKDRLFSDISGLERIAVDDLQEAVGGLDNLRSWLEEKKVLLQPEKRKTMKIKGLQTPRGVMLVGVPGCGKSLSAKTIAAQWKLPLYRLDFATVQGSYVGQSEQQLRNALMAAETVSPCILWIDEIEKGLVYNNFDSSGVSTRMVGQFLFWLQECKKQVFVVATANDVSKLPLELLRRGRFDELFFLDLPMPEERREIIGIYMHKYLDMDPGSDLMEGLVAMSEGFTGADIEAAVREVAYHVLADDGYILTDESLLTEFRRIVPLSKTNPERIEAIRAWGRDRAVPASRNR